MADDSSKRPYPADSGSAEATELLRATVAGDGGAAACLMPLVYDQLRALASADLARERADHTLLATALVHEAWMRLIDRRDAGSADREHILALAAQSMRRMLVEHARAYAAEKRGGGRWDRVTLSESDPVQLGRELSLVELGDLIERLSVEHERMGQVVTLRFLGGLTHAEIARVLCIAESTADADWRVVRAWLMRELSDGDRV